MKTEPNDVYKMELHETIVVDDKYNYATHIRRVASGWIYACIQQNSATGDWVVMSTCFVPFDNHFMAPYKESK